jgi:nucleoside-diphosphate-sugar epimerase
MPARIVLAGASGAIGSRLVPLLVGAGHHVVGTTRSAAKAAALRRLGVEPVVVDVYDRAGLTGAVAAARPVVVMHQLTDLPKDLDPRLMAEALPRNARLREEGTRNLVAAALAAGARRLVAQSVAWLYAAGPEPHGEDDPLDHAADGARRVTLRGILALEEATLNSPPLAGVVLRYGHLYGPGTHTTVRPDVAPLHVDAAAEAALLAVDRGSPGIFNIAEPDRHVASDKAMRELGWTADFRLPAA